MAARGVQVEVTYCERWDPERRTMDGPLSVAAARKRYSTGERLGVLLGPPARPCAVIEVTGAEDEIVAWRFDEHLRRTFLFEFRTLGLGNMALLRMAEWQYADADRPEFDTAAPRRLTTFGGEGVTVAEPAGRSEVPFRTLDRHDDRWFDVPRFGQWSRLATFLLDLPEPRDRHRIVQRVEPAPDRTWEQVGEGWPGAERTPMFGPPARYSLGPDASGSCPEVVVETRPVGELMMPTGRLVAADPGLLDDELEPFTVALPPGRHPVTLAVARFVDRPDHVRVAAGRVSVRDAPVTSWEPALLPGQDPDALEEGEFFAVGVDAGMLSFFDAAMLPGLVKLSETWDERRGLWDELTDGVNREDTVELEDPVTRTNLIAFTSGWGDGGYPVWIGRGADGDVVCVVIDTFVLDEATLLGPVSDR